MRIIFETNQRIDDIINAFKKEGYITGSEIIRMALIYTFENKFGKHVDKLRNKDIKGSNICEQLHGKVVGNVCAYTIYEKLNDKYVESFSAEIPVADLRQAHVDDQFKPSRESCEKVPGFQAK